MALARGTNYSQSPPRTQAGGQALECWDNPWRRSASVLRGLDPHTALLAAPASSSAIGRRPSPPTLSSRKTTAFAGAGSRALLLIRTASTASTQALPHPGSLHPAGPGTLTCGAPPQPCLGTARTLPPLGSRVRRPSRGRYPRVFARTAPSTGLPALQAAARSLECERVESKRMNEGE